MVGRQIEVYLRDELHDVALGRLTPGGEQLAIAVQRLHACRSTQVAHENRHKSVKCVEFAAHAIALALWIDSGKYRTTSNLSRRPNVPEKSAEPTPTMMIDIGCDDAAMIAA